MTDKRKNMEQEKWMLTLYKLFWMFVLGGVIGFLAETVWCRFAFREFTSRTSNLFFPISCIWGFGCVIISLGLKRNRWEHPLYIFLKGTLLCAGFEFLCGCLGELILGVTFWDYTSVPFHIGKYINVPFCFVWGILSFAWIKWVYPFLDEKLEDFLIKTGYVWTRCLFVFMVVTSLITGVALLRMQDRKVHITPSNYIESALDRYFPDSVLQAYFPKMKEAGIYE